VAEVRKQLEHFPGDVEGMMKLAAIQAEDLHDLARRDGDTQRAFAPTRPASQSGRRRPANSGRLADEIWRDPAAARAAFERIVQMFPDSSFSHAAEQRIAHLDGVNQTREFRENSRLQSPFPRARPRPARNRGSD
jgi:hypothetical protein